MRRLICCALLLVWYVFANGQCLKTEAEYKRFFQENIRSIHKIEGIWNFEQKKYMIDFYGREHSASYKSFKVAIIKSEDKFRMCFIDDTNYDQVELMPTASSDFFIFQKIYLQDLSYYKLSTNAMLKNDFYLEFTLDVTDKLHKDFRRDVGRQTYDNNTCLHNWKGMKLFPSSIEVANTTKEEERRNSLSTGTGFAVTTEGLIVTNYHVIENATSIMIKGINGNFQESYRASVLQKDSAMDLAIIKLVDPSIKIQGRIPYAFKFGTLDVGQQINVLGFPLTATMGEEIKYTNGTVSSKSGFQGNISCYQVSAPIHPGSSGGPLFDSKGNIVGVICAKHRGAENASYAIKSTYLLSMLESLTPTPKLSTANSLATLSIQNQIKLIKQFVYLIEVKYN